MVNDVIKGIALKLNELYPDYEIDIEDVEQDLNEPCFLIESIEIGHKPYIMNRYKQSVPMQVVFFPKQDLDMVEKMNEVGETLLLGLRMITLPDGNGVWCRNLKAQRVDDVMHITFDVDVFIRIHVQKDEMEDMEVDVRTEG